MTSLHTTSKIALGAAFAVALLAGCNKRPADQPPTPTTESTAPSTPSRTPTPAPGTMPDATTPPATGSESPTKPPGQ
ncbi:hypothetical protein [Burkholderia sp. LMU1-1-1.1]|uniref:hypothetical protein n=1 Tax=Burkholderia sp. LMU1-1-1.1 TaxID=3135266 RepID=UPI0034283FE6